MLQLYLLSVCCDVLAGFALVLNSDSMPDFGGTGGGAASLADTDSVASQAAGHISGRLDVYPFVLGIVSVLTGFLVLISPIEGSTPFLGDLLPSVCAMISGGALIYRYFINENKAKTGKIALFGIFVRTNQKLIGYISIFAGILHFLFPKVFFL